MFIYSFVFVLMMVYFMYMNICILMFIVFRVWITDSSISNNRPTDSPTVAISHQVSPSGERAATKRLQQLAKAWTGRRTEE